jgi:hypothetical protein
VLCLLYVPYECSLPSVPFPLFPSRFSLPSFPTRSSQWCLWLTQVPFFPSLCIPFPPLPFPLFPSLFPYWRLCSRPPFLFSIMLPFSFPIFDYALTLCPWCPYVTFARLLEMQFLCSKCLSVRTGQLLFVHKTIFWKCHINLVQECPLEIMSARALLKMGARALLNNECSSPQKDGCSCPLRKWVRAPIFQESTSWTHSFMIPFYIHMCSFICSLIECSSNGECSCPSERWVLEPPK